MDAKEYPQLGRPRRSVLSIIFYGIAELIVVAGLVLTVVLLATQGTYGTATRSLPVRGNLTIGFLLLNGTLAALAFWAIGAVISYLHEMREYARIIAQQAVPGFPCLRTPRT